MIIDKCVSRSLKWFDIVFSVPCELEPAVLYVVGSVMWGLLVGEN
eukprot:SAG22_NODE_1464_length_4358_cov_537.962902_4_plen_45_part_00